MNYTPSYELLELIYKKTHKMHDFIFYQSLVKKKLSKSIFII